MLYYIALTWNDADADRTLAAKTLLRRFQACSPRWSIVLDEEGLAVSCYRPSADHITETYALTQRRGVVLGKLFEKNYIEKLDTREALPARVRLDDTCSARIIASAGRDLIDRYWGAYLAFLRDPVTRKRWVILDPSGGIPCHHTQIRGVDVYFLRLEDCERLGPPPFSINSRYLLGYLMYSSVCVRETGLKEVSSVLSGECIEHRGAARTPAFYWNPLEIAKMDRIEDPAEAVRLTRQTVRACVHAWASCFDGIQHNLSGGLDSSIVLSCLADAPNRPRVLCVNNYAAGSSSSDERNFARHAAQRAHCELIEHEINRDISLEPIREGPRSLYPFPWLYDPAGAAEQMEFTRSRGITGVFSGEGGDELFYRHGPLPTAVDYAWHHGIGRSLLRIALDDATLDRVSLSIVLRLVYRYGLRKRSFCIQDCVPASHRPLMSPDARKKAAADPTLWHPLYRDTPDSPPLKFRHAYMFTLLSSSGYSPRGFEDAPAGLNPLLSQPCVELALRIPTYVLRDGGHDRAIARRAFAADVPQEIIQRSAKGIDDTYRPGIILRNIDLVRELLLGGYLAQNGFLDVATLEQVLSGQLTRVQSSTAELCTYLNAEVFARSWNAEHRQAVA